MEALRIDDVFSAIQELWPRCRMTKPEFTHGVWLRLRGYGVDVVQSALKRHRALYLDAIRPEWKTLFRELASDGGEDARTNEFQVLLTQLRKHLEKNGVKGVNDWSDADVFQNHLDANPGARKGIVNGWRAYFVDGGETAPDFLVS